MLKSAVTYEKLLLGASGLIAGFLFFLFIGGQPTRRALAANWPLLTLAGLGLGAYSLVLVLPRYVGASMMLLWVALFAAVRAPTDERWARVAKYVTLAVAATMLLLVLGHIADTAYTTMTVGATPAARDQVTAAVGLQAMGLRAGDKVAVIGDGGTNPWARLGRFRIVAEAASATNFWASSPEHRDAAYDCLRRSGARAVITWDPPASAKNPHWKQISGTNYYAYFFSN
jgi:hypothetical protein